MLLKITSVCRMNCTHCLDSCTENGIHMDMDTFYQSVKFIKDIGARVIMITGGEPLENPHFFEMMEYMKANFDKRLLCVASNGMFLQDAKLRYKMEKLGVSVQITNDERYYPIKIPKFPHPNFMYETHIRGLVPQGRAKDMDCNYNTPSCFNLRSLNINNNFSLKHSVSIQEGNQKFCKPTVCPDGSIVLGESLECMRIGTVYDSQETLQENISKMRCNTCGLISNLPENYRRVIKMI